MRSLHPGPGGWTPPPPLVADTSCYLPLERQSKQAQAGKAPLLDIIFSFALLAHAGPLGMEDTTLPSCPAAPAPQDFANSLRPCHAGPHLQRVQAAILLIQGLWKSRDGKSNK